MKYLIILLSLLLSGYSSDNTIFDFNKRSNLSNWRVVDDGVMGGLSRGNIILNEDGHAEYSGYVTTENNGGFSSVRYNFAPKNISNYNFVVLTVKGDGRTYQFRLKQNKYNRYSYVSYFDTSGKWQEVKIPLTSFYPSYRGYKLNRPNFNGEKLEEIAILIGNKKNENFRLLIDSIKLE